MSLIMRFDRLEGYSNSLSTVRNARVLVQNRYAVARGRTGGQTVSVILHELPPVSMETRSLPRAVLYRQPFRAIVPLRLAAIIPQP